MKAQLNLGDQLYGLLPMVYRNRDNPVRDADGKILEPGDLQKWAAAQGIALDQAHRTLVQMLYDHFPDEAGVDETGAPRSCQPWLLPYFAQLLDVSLVSPSLAGQRAEIAKAVAWRQSKGTLPNVEDIAQDVGQFEVEIWEGWKRVAVTPRIGDPLLPAKALGEPQELDMDSLPPTRRVFHPGLRAATVDFRQRSRAAQCDANNPAAHATVFQGTTVAWRRINPHGVPCLPGSYQDSSQRVADVRTPTWNRGLYHPRRALLFMPPPDGYFAPHPHTLDWATVSGESDFGNELIEIRSGTTRFRGHEVPLRTVRGLTPNPLKITGPIGLDTEAVYRFENVWLHGNLDIKHAKAEMRNCAAHKVIVHTHEVDEPVLDARGCLLRRVQVASGLARFEYCTVLLSLVSERIQASDCIFLPDIHRNIAGPGAPAQGCLRFSRLSNQVLPPALATLDASNTHARPWFFSDVFGQPGCGVLHPGADKRIRFGAEDGGEMGAYHDRLYVLREAAMLDKLKDYLPVGQEAVLIPDPTLSCPPPRSL